MKTSTDKIQSSKTFLCHLIITIVTLLIMMMILICLYLFLSSLPLIFSSQNDSFSLQASKWPQIREESRKYGIYSFCKSDFNKRRDICNKSAAISSLISKNYDIDDDDFMEPNCYCDDNCDRFGDCCIDKAASMAGRANTWNRWSCVDVPIREHGIYALQKCPNNWINRTDVLSKYITEMCVGKVDSFLQWMPVFSNDSGILYRNVFCALCNSDHRNLKDWNVTISCDQKIPDSVLKSYLNENNFNITSGLWEFTLNHTKHLCQPSIPELEMLDSRLKYNTRFCRFAIDKCSQEYIAANGRNDVVINCDFYMFMVYTGRSVFKNLNCAKCNHLNATKMRQLDCNLANAVTSSRSSKIDEITSMRILFDLTPAQPCQLEDGNIYDPVSAECLTVRCGPSYHLNKRLLRCESIVIQWNGTLLKSDCMRIFINESDYIYYSDGMILLQDSGQLLESDSYQPYSYYDGGKKSHKNGILICYDRHHRYAAPFVYDHFQGFLSFITLSISIVGLIGYLGVFLLVPKLRNLRAMMVMSLSGALLAASIAFVCGVLSRPQVEEKILQNERGSLFCVITAVSIHYFYLAAFAWMNVMAYDAWKSFKRTHERLSNSLIHFLKYSLYSWLFPAFIVLVACSFDLSNIGSEYQPLYGHRVCWISQKKALLAFFVLPVTIIVLINIAFFSWTAYVLLRTNRQTIMACNSKHVKENSQRFILYVRLAIIMGLTWIFGTLATLTSLSFLWYPFIIFNGLQGAFIFFYFTCKADVYRHLKERISFLLHGREPLSNSSSSKTRSSSLMPSNSSQMTRR